MKQTGNLNNCFSLPRRLPVTCLYILFLFHLSVMRVQAQNCPPNIDFENGRFDGWTCYTGSVAAAGTQNVISLVPSGGPVTGRHNMYNTGANNDTDFFGNFSVYCPNGSGHSIRLGNNRGGAEAEGVSYEFTIPAGQNTYSLIYHYAVVFQDPFHQVFQQPRLEIEAINLTDNEVLSCSSFAFFPNGSPLPGFLLSRKKQDGVDVWYKNWESVTMNLNDKAGKTIRLFFKTADCTFSAHFGYAYIDVNSECSSEFTGNIYCKDDTAITVTAPYGYKKYTWYNSNFTQILGTQQTISFSPPPPQGTILPVAVEPYSGYGCPDTFYAPIYDTLRLSANAGANAYSCNQQPVRLGVNPKPGVRYSWQPSSDLSNPNIANPWASPATTTQYVLTVSTAGGGCAVVDTVVVTAPVFDTGITLTGKANFCITSNDSAVLTAQPYRRIQWYRDSVLINGATGTRYKVNQPGTYYAVVENDSGCMQGTSSRAIIIEKPLPGITYPVVIAVANIIMPVQARPIGVSALWKPPFFLNNAGSYKPEFNGTRDQQYTVELTTAAGCVTTDSQLVKVVREISFYVPGAFTPNKDGLNDYLLPVSTGITEIRYFRVYNRWGQLLFQLTPGSPGWDGYFNGIAQTTQTVVWMAEGIGVDKKRYRQKGTAVLIR
jgi:gliding motility-associated-like protein